MSAAPAPSRPIPDSGARPDAPGLAAIAVYGLPVLGMNFYFILMMVMYMIFATDVLLISPGVIGGILLVAKVWVAVASPLAGYYSDRTSSRLGRRKSWMLATSIPLACFGVAAWAPPAALDGFALNAWVAVAVIGFYTAHTSFEVPHSALGAELSPELRDRNWIFGSRHLLGTLGMFAGFGFGAAVLQELEGQEARDAALQLAVGAGLVTMLCIGLAVAMLPRERADYAGRGAHSALTAVRDVWRNPHARLLLFVQFIEMLGLGGIGVLFPYAMKYVMKTPELLSQVLVVYPISGLLATPLWVWLGGRFEKRRVWLFAMMLGGIGFSLLYFVQEGRFPLMLAGALISGTAMGCASTIGRALKADIIDYDEYETGERKEGAYFAAWDFVTKLAGGLMMAVVGLTLQWVGYAENQEQTEATKHAIRFLMGGVPAVGFAIGIIAFSRFSFTQAEHTRIRAVIDARSKSP